MPTTYDGIIYDQSGAVFNVKSSAYGATGNGSTDDTAAIQSAIQAAQNAGGGTVFLPAGDYKITNSLDLLPPTATVGNSILLVGSTAGSRILIDSATADGIVVGRPDMGSTPAVGPNDCAIRNLTLTSGVSRTAGAAIKVWAANGLDIEDVQIDSQYNGIVIQGGTLNPTFPYVVGVHINRGRHINFSSSNSIGIWINGTSYTSDIFINGIISDSGAVRHAAGLRITGSGGAFITNCDFLGATYGMLLDPGSTEFQAPIATNQVNFLSVENCDFDTNATHGIYFNPQNGGQVRGCAFTTCWTSNNQASGVRIDGNIANTTQGLEFVNHRGLVNTDGFFIGVSARDVHIDSAMLAGNTGSGVIVGASVTGIAVRNSRIGEFMGFGANAYGVYITSGCSDFIVANNNLLGNSSDNFLNGSPSAPSITTPNLM